jgi:hypothetical protein
MSNWQNLKRKIDQQKVSSESKSTNKFYPKRPKRSIEISEDEGQTRINLKELVARKSTLVSATEIPTPVDLIKRNDKNKFKDNYVALDCEMVGIGERGM